MSRFPFFIIYLILEQVIVIIAVAHFKRKPGYWRDRFEPLKDR